MGDEQLGMFGLKLPFFKVGDRVVLKEGDSFEAQKRLRGRVQVVVEVMDKTDDEDTSGQWVKTDLMDGWISRAWFKYYEKE